MTGFLSSAFNVPANVSKQKIAIRPRDSNFKWTLPDASSMVLGVMTQFLLVSDVAAGKMNSTVGVIVGLGHALSPTTCHISDSVRKSLDFGLTREAVDGMDP